MVELLPAQTISTNGASESKSISKDSFARVSVILSSISGSLSLYVETSSDNVNWKAVYSKTAIALPDELDLIAYDLGTYIRLRYEISTGGTATLSAASFDSLQSYSTVKEFHRFCFNTNIPDENIALALVNASETADSYLSSKYTLPLKSWGSDLSQKVSHIAEYDLATSLGLNAESNDYLILKDLRDNAIRWLTDTAKGLIKPNIVDSATATNTGSDLQKVVWYSSELRGW